MVTALTAVKLTETIWSHKIRLYDADRGYTCATLSMRTYFGGLLVCEDLWVDPVELKDDFVHQVCVQSLLSSEEGAVLYQLLTKTVCQRNQRGEVFFNK